MASFEIGYYLAGLFFAGFGLVVMLDAGWRLCVAVKAWLERVREVEK